MRRLLIGSTLMLALLSFGQANATPQYVLRASALPQTPLTRKVANKSLQRSLRVAHQTLAKSYTRAASGDAYFAQPARQQLWQVVDRLTASRTGRENAPLKQALKELKQFKSEFSSYRETGDQRLQARMLEGYSAKRPGMKTLLQRVFVAAGMGQVEAFLDNAPN